MEAQVEAILSSACDGALDETLVRSKKTHIL
jgi:hypothetical protein